MVTAGFQTLSENVVIGDIAVESDGEPFPHPPVDTLERLGQIVILSTAGRVARVTDGRRSGVLVHQAVVLVGLIEVEDLLHRSQILVSLQDPVPGGIVGTETGAQLTPILQVEERADDDRRDIPCGISLPRLVDGDDAAFFFQSIHDSPAPIVPLPNLDLTLCPGEDQRQGRA